MIVTRRIFHVSREKLYALFSDPARCQSWWGPAGFKNRFVEFDLRPGGFWRLVMTGPDGREYALTKRFETVVPSRRVVVTHIQDGHAFELEMDYAEAGFGSTELIWTMALDDPQEEAKLRGFLVKANEENFDRLAALL